VQAVVIKQNPFVADQSLQVYSEEHFRKSLPQAQFDFKFVVHTIGI